MTNRDWRDVRDGANLNQDKVAQHEQSMMIAYRVPDDPKMLRETLCLAQSALLSLPIGQMHIDRLQRLINACDVHRPLGPDGKHGNLHTPTCGCEGKPDPMPKNDGTYSDFYAAYSAWLDRHPEADEMGG